MKLLIGFLFTVLKIFKMASHPHEHRMNREEALAEIFADRDSDVSDFSDSEFEASVSEESEEEEEGDESEEDESGEGGDGEEHEPENARGAVRGNRGVRGERGRGRGRANRARITREEQERLLEAKWTSVDQDPQIPQFTATPGIQVPLPNEPSAGDFMKLFLTDQLFDLLVTQTNLYASQYKRNNPNLPRHSQANYWFDTTRNEMKKFLALTLLMGIVKKPELSDYWSTNALLKGSVFNSVMPRNRYQTILRFLHFADNSQFDPNDPERDRLYKVRPLVDHLVSKFKSTYIPEKEISVDEELLLWKGRLVFKQYIPLKRARFRIKMFSLCENSGYLWNSYVYLGKEPDRHATDRQLVNRLGLSGAVIPRLMENLLDKGYHVYVDNWYTSEALFTYLSEHDTAACGTARKNRLKLPATFTTPNLPKGEHRFRRHENMLAIRFNDKKEIYFLSTIHKANVINTRKRDRHGNVVRKLQLVDDYNKYMGGVDRNDEMIGTYSCMRKSMKWTKKVAFHFIEEGLLNAHILYAKEGGRKPLLRFKLECINFLLAASASEPSAPTASDRFSGRHFPELIPPTQSKQHPQKRCIVCTSNKKRKESRYQCGDCAHKPGLCPAPCFKIYHTE